MAHRTRPLHNFDLPELRWANQRLLRCMNLTDGGGGYGGVNGGDCGGIDAVREKLMFDLRAAAENMKLSMVSPAEKNAGEVSPAEARPWNLRTRRAACSAPERERGRRERAEAEKETPVKFSVGLSRAEIVEDFKAMAGIRPPRRPKKRTRTVQRELDQLFPGLWLTEITPDTYKVDDVEE